MRANLIVSVVLSIFVGVAGMAVLRADSDRDTSNDSDARIEIGMAYVRTQGIKLNLKGRDRSQVGLGSYLVNAVGGCNDCHTAPSYTVDPVRVPRSAQASQCGVLPRGWSSVRSFCLA